VEKERRKWVKKGGRGEGKGEVKEGDQKM